MRRIKASQARSYFQERVKTNVKTMTDMADIMRRHPGEFTQQDVDKVRIYLTGQLEHAIQNMVIAVIGSPKGEFDFDMEVPSVPQITLQPRIHVSASETAIARVREMFDGGPSSEALADAVAEVEAMEGVREASRPTTTRLPPGPTRMKPTGRLFGTKEVVRELVPVARVPGDKFDDAGAVPDKKTGGIKDAGFIDD